MEGHLYSVLLEKGTRSRGGIPRDDAQKTLYVDGIRAAFQSVQQYESQLPAVEMIDDQVIIVRRAQHFATQRDNPAASC